MTVEDLQELLINFLQSFGLVMLGSTTLLLSWVAIVLFAIAVCAVLWNANYQYKQTAYYRITHKSYFQMRFDSGALGEYQIYKRLREMEKNGAKFLFNIYLPKDNNQTTEIDVLMLCKQGVFVFESKNYSGWIFGNENQYRWTQVLPKGQGYSQKEYFYNPVRQNDVHIQWLKPFLKTPTTIFSVIAFSERCTLKDVTVERADVKVINRYSVEAVVQICCVKVPPEQWMSDTEIQALYDTLYPYTQTSVETKQKHIDDIQRSYHKEAEEHVCPKCGGKLVLRTAKRGANSGNTFYGCENFPSCRYIKTINKK